ncbi:hypothetical protein ST45_02685 [Prevotella pectinovora]|nr:hypothetical protein ST45_02685 [Prevotella pectinovora]
MIFLPTSAPTWPQTHPNLPKGKEQITPAIDDSPHLASPEGEGQILLCLIINSQSNLHLPYGGEREGAETRR